MDALPNDNNKIFRFALILDQMKVLSILPPFLPVDQIRMALDQVIPNGEIRTDTDFDSSDAEVLIVTTFTKLDSSLLGKMPKLKFVQVASTGYDNVDIQALVERKILLSNIPTANKESVAEHVIAMALAQLKNLMHFHSEIVRGNWPFLTNSRELLGKNFGIIGMGAIGKKLAERLLFFGTNTTYFDVARLSEDQEDEFGVTFRDLDDILSESDLISLHLPLTQETKNLIGDSAFGRMKEGAILINTSRGGIVDEKALVNAIKKRGIRACIDVYEEEPPNRDSEIFKLDGVIFSPHIAGVTVESQQRFLTETASNVLKYIQGLSPLYQVI